VKHGVRIGITNVYDSEVGNPQLPKKLQALKRHRTRVRWAEVAVALLVLAAIVAAFVLVSKKSTRSLSSVPEKSIAILPFANLSEEKANAYFAEGIQNEILTRLATVRDLKVISRTSTAKYQTKPDNLKTVAQELGVATILEGAVQKAGDKVRVNVQLIDARADTHPWGKSYDRDLKDVLGVESEVSQEIAEALQANPFAKRIPYSSLNPDARHGSIRSFFKR
jgi:TolB-like protein